MGNKTDQDDARMIGARLAPPTTPDRDTIKQDRAALDAPHTADRPPTPEEEAVADAADDLDPDAAEAYKEALERGAAQQGEGRPGR
jgi:hypothetical protein